MHLLLFTNSAQRELVSICTQIIHNRNCLSLPYILAQRSHTIIFHITLPTQRKDILDGLYPIITGVSLKINDFLLRRGEAGEAIFTGLRGPPRGRGGAGGTCRVGRAGHHVEVATSESRHQLWWSAEGVELTSSLLYFQPSDGRFSGNEIWVSTIIERSLRRNMSNFPFKNHRTRQEKGW